MTFQSMLHRGALKAATVAVAGVLAVSAGAQVVASSIPHRQIYPEISASPANIHTAIIQASRQHKRVILDFGGDWCPDCQVLNIYFNESPNRELMDKYFVRVNVNIGHEDANVDIAHHYGVPLTGVPALAVLDSHGKLLYAQTKEFSNMRNMQSSDLTAFLNKWKP
jgi:thiol:disulfide interchange protein